MPIQFRCAACQQLLGIAKRKAGSVVDCPSCKVKTLVPQTSTENEPTIPPVRRDRTQPLSIFDRVDVDKLLQKPTRPELVEQEGGSSVAVAPPPVRRKMVFTPDPLENRGPEPVEEPQAMPRLEAGEIEPVDDEPFALSPVPTLTSSKSTVSGVWLSVYLAVGGLLVLGAFLGGHWVGAHRPLF
jgi:phage FluMu protein Com